MRVRNYYRKWAMKKLTVREQKLIKVRFNNRLMRENREEVLALKSGGEWRKPRR